MNCKPGDLAVIVHTGSSAAGQSLRGKIVTVLSDAPQGIDFRLPNGALHADLTPHRGHQWICQFHQPVQAPIDWGGTVSTFYAPIPDGCLHPIRDNPGQDETLQWLPVPSKEIA